MAAGATENSILAACQIIPVRDLFFLPKPENMIAFFPPSLS